MNVVGKKLTENILMELAQGDEATLIETLEMLEEIQGKLLYSKCDVLYKLTCPQDLVRAKKNIDSFAKSWMDGFEKNSCFYDIGSNVGTFSIYAAKRHGAPFRAYAFELHFASFATMCENIVANDLGCRVVPLSIALSKTSGVGTALLRSLNSGSALHQLDEPIDYKGDSFKPQSQIPVFKSTIDALCGDLNFEPPRYLKIDTDGNECDVLKGAEFTLTKAKNVDVLVEFVHHSNANDRLQNMVDFMKDCGFVIKGCSRRRLVTNFPIEDILFTKN